MAQLYFIVPYVNQYYTNPWLLAGIIPRPVTFVASTNTMPKGEINIPTTFMRESWLPPAYVFEQQRRFHPPTATESLMNFITGYPASLGRSLRWLLVPPRPGSGRSIFIGVKG